jgi:hypothetical protein
MESTGLRDAERTVNACIWPRVESATVYHQYVSKDSQQRKDAKYNLKRNRKGTPGYARRLQTSRNYFKSVPSYPKRKWEDWEVKFMQEHPLNSVREIADALKRGIMSVIRKKQHMAGKHGYGRGKNGKRTASKKNTNVPPEQAR